MKRTKDQPVYMLLYNRMDDGKPPAWGQFTFHARDDKDAQDKVLVWARYHSFHPRRVAARLATQEEINHDPSWLHDEWVS